MRNGVHLHNADDAQLLLIGLYVYRFIDIMHNMSQANNTEIPEDVRASVNEHIALVGLLGLI